MNLSVLPFNTPMTYDILVVKAVLPGDPKKLSMPGSLLRSSSCRSTGTTVVKRGNLRYIVGSGLTLLTNSYNMEGILLLESSDS